MVDVKLGTQNRMYLFSEAGTMQFVKESFLKQSVPGYKEGFPTWLAVRYLRQNRSAYHYHAGGSIWMATVPPEIARPGEILSISVSLLTAEEFVGGLNVVELANEAGFSWLPNFVEVKCVRSSNKVWFQARQDPPFEGTSEFAFHGNTSNRLGFVTGVGCYLGVTVSDIFGQARDMRIYHDGCSAPRFGFREGTRFPRISFLSFDGIRLRLVYGSPTLRVATIYLDDPSKLYRLGSMHKELSTRMADHFSGAFEVCQTDLLREAERAMLRSKFRYPHGRLGAEIAYAIATQKLGIKDLVLRDPSREGADLFTRDGKVVIEARMLALSEVLHATALKRELELHLTRMRMRLASDLSYYQSAETGYAFLSYLDSGAINTIIYRVDRK